MSPLRRKLLVLVTKIVLAGATVILAICAIPASFDGGEDVPLDFLIVDSATGSPLPGALVRVVSVFEPAPDPPFPDIGSKSDGTARLIRPLHVKGERSAFKVTGTVELGRWWLEVTRPKYANVRIPLIEVTGETGDLAHPRVHRVALTKGEVSDDPLKGVAGTYRNSDNHTLELYPDGRFALIRSGAQPYGRATREGGRLILTPVSRPGHDVDPTVQLRYVPFSWGDELFLVGEQDVPLAARALLRGLATRGTRAMPEVATLFRRADPGPATSAFPPLAPHVLATAWASLSPKECAQTLIELAMPEPASSVRPSKSWAKRPG